MQRIVAGKPYQFIPPYFGRFWPTVFTHVFPFYLRKQAGIESIDFIGANHLRQSILSKHRIILAPNHSRRSDPMLVALLAKSVRQPFHYLTNWHAFLESKMQGWLIRRLGGFSIYREGLDRKALRVSGQLLTMGRRPLVIFPEGEVSRTNDFLCPFMRGLSFIVKAASDALAKQAFSPKIVVHPVAIKYVLVSDPEESLHRVLDDIEAHFRWPKTKLPLLKRIAKIGRHLLSIKEMENLGYVQKGEISSRVHQLKECLLLELENRWLSSKPRSCFMSRINSLRGVILKRILREGNNKKALQNGQLALEKIDLAARLSNYPYRYLRDNPTVEKMTETVECLEEDVLHRVRTHGRWKAKVQVGETIEVKAGEFHSLTEQVYGCIQTMLDALREPARVEWNPVADHIRVAAG